LLGKRSNGIVQSHWFAIVIKFEQFHRKAGDNIMTTSSTYALLGAFTFLALLPAWEASGQQITTQLPTNARPVHYTVSLTPDAAKLSFKALAAIELDILKPSNSITLNSADLAFQIVTLRSGSTKPIRAKVKVNANAQTAAFTFPSVLKLGRYTLDISYSGKISQQPSGLFALDHKDPKGVSKRSLFTQFEAADARRFLPSWDEPNYKATFDLKAVVSANQMAVSNMPVVSRRELGGGKAEVAFQRSPKMSTYLLFFGLGEFDRIITKVGPTEVGIVTSRGNADKGQYALDASAKIVAFFNDYFGIPYPLPKLDNVGGPGQSDFFSAMENWGAIFTFDHSLLVDPKITSTMDKQYVFATATHEIAHQWFGNLVTMAWWDDLWLNEGFASWLEAKTTAHFNPDWQRELLNMDQRQGAMSLDAYATTHPVVQPIKTVDQTEQAFDAITYIKGSSVIAMLENFAGETTWRDGVRAYMKKHAYGNTQTDDLWAAVEAAGAKGLVQIAHDFTKQPGVPLVKVSSAKCVAGQTDVALEQGEFSRDQKARADAKPLRWNIPIIARTLGNEPQRIVISGGKATVSVPGCGPLVVNAGQTGYYRVLYAPDMVAPLQKTFTQLAPVDQLGLLYDGLQLSYSDYQPMSIALDLLSAASSSANPKVLESAAATYVTLHERFTGDNATQGRIAALASERFWPSLKQLGFKPVDGEPVLSANLRSKLIEVLGNMGNEHVTAEARRLFAMLSTDPTALDGSLKTTWLNVIASNADRQTWNALRLMGKNGEDQLVQSKLYSLLGAAKDKALVQDALTLALTPEPGATTSASIVSEAAANHPDQVVDFVLAHIEQIDALVGPSSRSTYVAGLARGSRDPAMLQKLETYAKTRLTPDSRKPVDGAIAAIQTRLSTEPKIKAGITEWLTRQGK
jgi:aminopeptidase N